MGIKQETIVTCDHCSREHKVAEIPQDEPYFLIKMEISTLDANGQKFLQKVDAVVCRWGVYDVLANGPYEAAKAEVEKRKGAIRRHEETLENDE